MPAALILGLAGLFGWGALQPRPTGFAPVEAGSAEPSTPAVEDGAPAAAESDPAPSEVILTHTLDARSTEEWVLFDFGSGRVVNGDLSSPVWDVAFRRTKLLTNSGATNPDGPGGAFDLGEVPLASASPPPSVEYTVDTLGGEDGDELENTAAGRWYQYSFITHIVSAKPNTYLFRTGGGSDALVQFDSYYCADEEPGCITFRYRLIPREPQPVG